jgi:hypothetical protein
MTPKKEGVLGAYRGPYRVDGLRESELFGAYFEIRDVRQGICAHVLGRDLEAGLLEAKRRATLLATAPELLDAAKDLVSASAVFQLREGETVDSDADFEALTKALRNLALVVMKAEGQSADEMLRTVTRRKT